MLKDGAGVAEAVSKGELPRTTAIVSGQATADAFGLHIVAENLADDPENATTFLFVRPFSYV